MGREIKLGGGEITVLKRIGLSGTQAHGRTLLEGTDDMEAAEVLETLKDLMNQGYVLSNKVSINTIEDAERAFFRVDPTYGRELKNAITGRRQEERPRRRRRS